jgi:hypothetical protein
MLEGCTMKNIKILFIPEEIQDTDFYSLNGIEQDMEDDLISSTEAGFMRGYLSS